jgi:hypothetical protein
MVRITAISCAPWRSSSPLSTKEPEAWSLKPLGLRAKPALSHAQAANWRRAAAGSYDQGVPEVTPDISLVLAVGNFEDAIGREVRRIANHLQSQQVAFEIVAVNDGCHDNSLALLRLLAGEVPQLRLCAADAAGRSFMRGAAEARAKVIAFSSADGPPGFPLSVLGWACSRLAPTGPRAVVLRGRCIVADRIACLAAIAAARGRGATLERRFERACEPLPIEIVGARRSGPSPGTARSSLVDRALLAPLRRFLAV